MSLTKICMVGAGRVGKLHSGSLKRYIPSGEVTALVDTSQSMLDETGDQFGIDERYIWELSRDRKFEKI